MLFFQQKMAPYLSPLLSVALFFVELRWSYVAYFLCLSLSLYSKFVDMTINLRLILNQTIFAFRFHIYCLFSWLSFTKRGWLCDFPPKEHRVTFGLPTCRLSYFTLVYLWCGRMADGRTVTWLPKFHGGVDHHIFLGMGLRSLFYLYFSTFSLAALTSLY